MKRLLLMRHAKAQDRSADGEDYDRPLRPVGRTEAAAMGRSLAAELPFELMLASGAARALETARLVGEAWHRDPSAIRIEDGLYEARPRDFFEVLRALPDTIDSAAVFAHNPGIGDTAACLLGGFNVFMPTAAAVALSFTFDCWAELDADCAEFGYYKSIQERFPGSSGRLAAPRDVEVSGGVVTVRNLRSLLG